MQKFFLISVFSFILFESSGQMLKKHPVYLYGQFTQTIYDQTLGNNPWGIGAGLQYLFNHFSKFSPTVEIAADGYLEDDKVLRLNSDGTPMKTVDYMVNLFAGVSYQPLKKFYLSLSAGPSLVSGETLFGLKPSFGFYFSKDQKWVVKISYINIFNRNQKTGEDFGSVSLSLGISIF